MALVDLGVGGLILYLVELCFEVLGSCDSGDVVASVLSVVMTIVSFVTIGALVAYLIRDHMRDIFLFDGGASRNPRQFPSRKRRPSIWDEGVRSVTRPVQGR